MCAFDINELLQENEEFNSARLFADIFYRFSVGVSIRLSQSSVFNDNFLLAPPAMLLNSGSSIGGSGGGVGGSCGVVGGSSYNSIGNMNSNNTPQHASNTMYIYPPSPQKLNSNKSNVTLPQKNNQNIIQNSIQNMSQNSSQNVFNISKGGAERVVERVGESRGVGGERGADSRGVGQRVGDSRGGAERVGGERVVAPFRSPSQDYTPPNTPNTPNAPIYTHTLNSIPPGLGIGLGGTLGAGPQRSLSLLALGAAQLGNTHFFFFFTLICFLFPLVRLILFFLF